MRRIECEREAEAFRAVSLGGWPDRSDEALRAHVATCAVCADVVAVALALHDEQRALVRDAPVLRSELAWWRAERRARDEAVEVAAQPIALVHAAAVVCTGIAAGALVGVTFGWLPPWLGEAWDLMSGGGAETSPLPDVASLGPWVLPIAVGLGAWLILAPVALYLSVTER